MAPPLLLDAFNSSMEGSSKHLTCIQKRRDAVSQLESEWFCHREAVEPWADGDGFSTSDMNVSHSLEHPPLAAFKVMNVSILNWRLGMRRTHKQSMGDPINPPAQ